MTDEQIKVLKDYGVCLGSLYEAYIDCVGGTLTGYRIAINDNEDDILFIGLKEFGGHSGCFVGELEDLFDGHCWYVDSEIIKKVERNTKGW